MRDCATYVIGGKTFTVTQISTDRLDIVNLACDGTRLEIYERDNERDSDLDFKTVCDTLKHVHNCLR